LVSNSSGSDFFGVDMTAKLALAQTACLSGLRQSNKCTGVELDPVPFKNTSLPLTHREARLEELRDPGLCARDIPSREKTLPLETISATADQEDIGRNCKPRRSGRSRSKARACRNIAARPLF
jgi:hypothetical protein